jgi:hypothetical protein
VSVPARQGSPRAGSIPAGRLRWCREKAHRHHTLCLDLTWRHSLTRMHRGPDCPQVQDKALAARSVVCIMHEPLTCVFAQIGGPHLSSRDRCMVGKRAGTSSSRNACSQPTCRLLLTKNALRGGPPRETLPSFLLHSWFCI